MHMKKALVPAVYISAWGGRWDVIDVASTSGCTSRILFPDEILSEGTAPSVYRNFPKSYNATYLTDGWDAPSCPSAYLETLQPRDRIRHIVEDHEDDDSNYWEELHRLRCEKQSEDLIISLVLDFVKDISYEDFFKRPRGPGIDAASKMDACLRSGPGISACLHRTGRSRARGTYQVRNGSHPILEMAHNLLGQTEMLEPPVVPQSPVQGPSVSWSSYIRTREMCK